MLYILGYTAFIGCNTLTAVTISSSITYIYYWAFAFCPNLVLVVIHPGITIIRPNAFVASGSLTYINIPATVTYTGSSYNKNNNKYYVDHR